MAKTNNVQIGFVALYKMINGLIGPKPARLYPTHEKALESAQKKDGGFPDNFCGVGKVRYHPCDE